MYLYLFLMCLSLWVWILHCRTSGHEACLRLLDSQAGELRSRVVELERSHATLREVSGKVVEVLEERIGETIVIPSIGFES